MIEELIERLKLTPEERLQAEDEALALLRSLGKIVGVDGFERRDIAYTVRIFVAEAQLNKVLKDPDLYYLDRNVKIKEVDDFYAAFIPLREAIKEVKG